MMLFRPRDADPMRTTKAQPGERRDKLRGCIPSCAAVTDLERIFFVTHSVKWPCHLCRRMQKHLDFLQVVNDCDNFPQNDLYNDEDWKSSTARLWCFYLPSNKQIYGFVTADTVARMPWTSEFKVDEMTRSIHLDPKYGTSIAESSTAAITKLLSAAQTSASFPNLFSWPGEKFPVLGSPFSLAIDRAIAPYFGIASTGVQLTIFVRDELGSITGIWVAKRGADKPMYPNMLDNSVGGAVNFGETPFECLLREAKEELGIDARNAMSGGTISWFNIKDARSGIDSGLVEPGVQYVYDLEADSKTNFEPAEDGIQWLRKLNIDDIKAALSRHDFKPSSACVVIDFFVRHGIINAENNRDFAEVVSRLHRRLPVPTAYPLKTTRDTS